MNPPNQVAFSLGIGTLRRVATVAGLTAYASAAYASETVTYNYDSLGRLTGVGHSGTINNGVSATYSYDAADNRANVTVSGAPDALNLLPNPTLANSAEGWTLGSGTTVASGGAGEPATYVTSNSASVAAGIWRSNIPAPPGTQFEMSFDVRPGTAGQQFQLAVQWIDANGFYITQTVLDVFPSNTTQFTTYTKLVNKPANASTHIFYAQSVTGAIGKIGNLALRTVNFLPNPTLANSADGWMLGSGTTTAAGGTGEPATYVTSNSASVVAVISKSNIPAPPGTQFVMAFDVRPGAANQQFQLAVQWIDGNGNYINQTVLDVFPSDTMQFTTYNKVVPKPGNASTYTFYAQSVTGAVGKIGNLRFYP